MKVALDELKKAIKWIETNSRDPHINIVINDKMTIYCKDNYEAQVEIDLFDDSNMLPKIRKEDFLR